MGESKSLQVKAACNCDKNHYSGLIWPEVSDGLVFISLKIVEHYVK